MASQSDEPGRSGPPMDAATLFRRHAPFVARFLFRLGVPADSIDDLVQEVFLVAHGEGGYCEGPASPTTFLASIAVRLAANHRRRELTRSRLQQALSRDTPEQVAVTPLQVLEANETMQALQRALDALEPDLRVVFVLADLEQQPCTAIAASLGVAVGTIYWRLHVARQQFVSAAQEPARTSRFPARVTHGS